METRKFRRSNRAGDPVQEVPAYMSIFKPGEVNGVAESDAEDYVKRLLPNLDTSTADKLQRVRKMHKAVQAK